MKSEVPTISPLPFGAHNPESWLAFVKTLKQEPETASTGLFLTVTKTGKLSFRITREPKVVSQRELEELAREKGFPISEVYILAGKKALIVKDRNETPKGKKK